MGRWEVTFKATRVPVSVTSYRVFTAAALLLLTVGCASDSGDLDTSGDSASSIPEAVSGESSLGSGESWDVVVFSHSQGTGIADAYAPLASEILGVAVEPHDYGLPYLTATEALKYLDGTGYVDLGDIMSGAEVIVVAVAPENLESGWWNVCDPHGPPAGDLELLPEPTRDEIEAALGPFNTVLDEIVRLRNGQPTALFGFVEPFGQLVRWQELGIDDLCMNGWEAFLAAQSDAIEAHGGTIAHFIDAFHGPDHDQDPRLKGLIHPDGTHLSKEGIRLAAETLASYPIEPIRLVIP